MPLYEYRCRTCQARQSFASDVDASAAGWVLASVVADGKLTYVVACAAHRPAWVEEAVTGQRKGAKR